MSETDQLFSVCCMDFLESDARCSAAGKWTSTVNSVGRSSGAMTLLLLLLLLLSASMLPVQVLTRCVAECVRLRQLHASVRVSINFTLLAMIVTLCFSQLAIITSVCRFPGVLTSDTDNILSKFTTVPHFSNCCNLSILKFYD